MNDTNIIFTLPKELLTHIYSYDANHRIRLDKSEELLYEMNTYICDNDMCEKEFDIRHEDSVTDVNIFLTCNFCSKHCESYGK